MSVHAEHLYVRQVAFSLGDRTVDDCKRDLRTLHRETAKRSARKKQEFAIIDGICRLDMPTAAEGFGATAEMTGRPIGERHLSAAGAGVEGVKPSAWHNPNTLVKITLEEEASSTRHRNV
jgi:hypothetical protein